MLMAALAQCHPVHGCEERAGLQGAVVRPKAAAAASPTPATPAPAAIAADEASPVLRGAQRLGPAAPRHAAAIAPRPAVAEPLRLIALQECLQEEPRGERHAVLSHIKAESSPQGSAVGHR